MAQNDRLIEEMAEAFGSSVAAGIPREEILGAFEGTGLEDLAVVALCRAQDRFFIRRHETLYGPLGPAVPVGAR